MNYSHKVVVSEDSEEEFNKTFKYELKCNDDLKVVDVDFEFRDENPLFNKFTAIIYFI